MADSRLANALDPFCSEGIELGTYAETLFHCAGAASGDSSDRQQHQA